MAGLADATGLGLAPWRENLLLRELEATMRTLAARVLSYGNTQALLEAREGIGALIETLSEDTSSEVLSRRAIEALATLFRASDGHPPAAFARLAVNALEDALTVAYGEMAGAGEPAVVTHGAAALPGRIREVVVEVGPTIGLGDELLFAAALAERGEAAPGVSLRVSSRRPALWSWSDRAGPLPAPPPLGGIDHLVSLTPAERRRAAYLRLDFLDGPPGSPAYIGPTDVAYGGSWAMGRARGQIERPREDLRHVFRYPESLPECRWLEARWAAGRLMPPGAGGAGDAGGGGGAGMTAGTRVGVGDAGGGAAPARLVLQVLTAKPSLMFPPGFYVRTIEEMRGRYGAAIEVRLLPAPSTADAPIVATAAHALVAAFGTASVEVAEPMSLEEVIGTVRGADLVLGPDSFTTHVADLYRVPQVVIAHHEHRAWATPFRPRVDVHQSRSGVVALSDQAATAGASLLAARRGPLTDEQSRAAGEWRTRMGGVDGWVRGCLHGERTTDADGDAFSRAAAVQVLLAGNPSLRTEALRLGEHLPPARLDPGRYDDREEAAHALVRWYHRLTTTKLSGVLLACHAER